MNRRNLTTPPPSNSFVRFLEEILREIKPLTGQAKAFFKSFDKTKIIKDEHIVIDQTLNPRRGNFGRVGFGYMIEKGKQCVPVAIKKPILEDDLWTDELMFNNFLGEVWLLSSLEHHPNVVRFLGATVSSKNLKFYNVSAIMERCADDLASYLAENRNYFDDSILGGFRRSNRFDYKLTPFHLIKWALEIASGMEFLSKNEILHMDLAARNILLQTPFETAKYANTDPSLFTAKIGDFGLSKDLRKTLKTYYRPVRDLPFAIALLAPEVLEGEKFTIANDIWATGLLYYEIFSLGDRAFEHEYEMLTRWRMIEILDSKRAKLSRPNFAPLEIWDIIRNCLKIDPNERPHFTEIKSKLQELLEPDGGNTKLEPSTSTISVENMEQDRSLSSNDSETTSENKIVGEHPTSYVALESTPQGKLLSITSNKTSFLQCFDCAKIIMCHWIQIEGTIYKGDTFHVEFGWLIQKSRPVRRIAIKSLTLLTHDKELSYKNFIEQTKLLSSLDCHPNVVGLIGVTGAETVSRNYEVAAIMEYCHENLARYLSKHKLHFHDFDTGGLLKSLRNDYKLKPIHLLKWSLDIALGMNYLSSKRILHTNLHASNILLQLRKEVANIDEADPDMFSAKVCGFSSAIDLKQQSADFCHLKDRQLNYGILPPEAIMELKVNLGDMGYSDYEGHLTRLLLIKPEVLEKFRFTTEMDIWAIGLLYYEMFSLGGTPFSHWDLILHRDNMTSNWSTNNLSKPSCAPPDIWKIIQKCLNRNPSKRPTFN